MTLRSFYAVCISAFLFLGMSVAALAQDYSQMKIIAPPGGGMYLGQVDFQKGEDTENFEIASGRHAAMWSPYWPIQQDESGHPVFDVALAEKAWVEGRIVIVHAYEAGPHLEDNVQGFTVDKLLLGEYDPYLRRLAAQFREFGKPMFFSTAREPNGVISNYMGGFGKDGTKSSGWAIDTGRGYAEFDPKKFPNAQLYAGLGNPKKCDGLERMAAAQRYYHDFFVRQENLHFLTFDTMGWAMLPVPEEDMSTNERIFSKRCYDFSTLYPGDDYVDWVSVTWYLNGEEVPENQHIQHFANMLDFIGSFAKDKPVFVVELGFPDGKKTHSELAASRVRKGMQFLLSRPEIAGISFWSAPLHNFPFDSLLRPETPQGNAFEEIIGANPGKFHSCAYMSGGKLVPTCQQYIE